MNRKKLFYASILLLTTSLLLSTTRCSNFNKKTNVNDEIIIRKSLFNDNSSISNKSVFFKTVQDDKMIEYETIQGNVNIKWNISHLESTKNTKSELNNIYELFYSKNKNNDWELLGTTTDDAGYEWDTTSLTDGYNYELKVVATPVENLTGEARSVQLYSEPFHIVNSIVRPVIKYPKDGSTLTGLEKIIWTTELVIMVNIYGYCAKDKLNHNATFNIYISNNSGISWEFYTSLNPVSYNDGEEYYYHWPTDWHENGTQYKLKIEITSTSGFSIYGVSDGTFTLGNKVIKKPEPTTTISRIPYFNDSPSVVLGYVNTTTEKGLGEIIFEASPVIAGVVTLVSGGVVTLILIRRKLSSP